MKLHQCIRWEICFQRMWFAGPYFINIPCIVQYNCIYKMKSGVSTFRSSTVREPDAPGPHPVEMWMVSVIETYCLREIFCPILSSTPITSHFNRMGPRRIWLAKMSNFWKSRCQTSFCNCNTLYKDIYKICNCKPHPWKQISQRIHAWDFHSNRSTFEKSYCQNTKGPDFMKHGVYYICDGNVSGLHC